MADTTAKGRLGRRDLIRGLGGAALLPLLGACAPNYEKLPSPMRPGSRLDSLMGAIDPHLDITNAHTSERVNLRFFENGTYNRRAVQQFDWLFRDWRRNESPDIDPRVYWGLAAVADAARRQGHSGRITLLSGFRTKHTNDMLRKQGGGTASNSYHLRRRAADFRLDGIPAPEVADYAEWLQVGGVGRYGSSFTHIDSGPGRTWNG